MAEQNKTEIKTYHTLPLEAKEIREEVQKAAGSPKGYISASGCDVPYQTDFAMLDSWMDEIRKISGL